MDKATYLTDDRDHSVQDQRALEIFPGGKGHSLSLATTRLGASDVFDRAQGRPDVPEQPKATATQGLPT
jgi:hypothetical protein